MTYSSTYNNLMPLPTILDWQKGTAERGGGGGGGSGPSGSYLQSDSTLPWLGTIPINLMIMDVLLLWCTYLTIKLFVLC